MRRDALRAAGPSVTARAQVLGTFLAVIAQDEHYTAAVPNRAALRRRARALSTRRARPRRPRRPRSHRSWWATATAGRRLSGRGRTLARRHLTAPGPAAPATPYAQACFLAQAVRTGDTTDGRTAAALVLYAAALDDFLAYPHVPATAARLASAEQCLTAAARLRDPTDPQQLWAALAALCAAPSTPKPLRSRADCAGRQPRTDPAHPAARVHALCAAPGAPSTPAHACRRVSTHGPTRLD